MKNHPIRRAGSCSALLVLLLFFSACTTDTVAKAPDGTKALLYDGNGRQAYKFMAHTMTFSMQSGGTVDEKNFVSMITVNTGNNVRSYKIENFISGNKIPDTTILLAVSGRVAGLSILGADGATLAEYDHGKVAGGSVTFSKSDKDGTNYLRWIVGKNHMSSFVEGRNKDNEVVFSEITMFSAK